MIDGLGGTADTLRFWAIVGLLVGGLFFTLVSAAGVIRLPDVYSRAHTASQADTLGAGFALAAVALALGFQTAAVMTVILLFFIFVTNPTAAHAIARAAHEEGIEPWTERDDRTDRELIPDGGQGSDADPDTTGHPGDPDADATDHAHGGER